MNKQKKYKIIKKPADTQENGLDPYQYLTWVLNEAPKRTAVVPFWAASTNRFLFCVCCSAMIGL